MRLPCCRHLPTTGMQKMRYMATSGRSQKIFSSPRWSRTLVTTTFAAVALTSPVASLLPLRTQQRTKQFTRCFSSTSEGTSAGTNIQNIQQTQTEKDMTHHAMKIIESAIESVNPYTAVKNHFQIDHASILSIGGDGDKSVNLDLKGYSRIQVVGFGKASSAMASAVVQQLKPLDIQQISGLVICKDDHATEEEHQLLNQYNISVRYASHPVPDERSSEAAKELLEMVSTESGESAEKILVVCCISGGGSALFCSPHQDLSLQDLQDTNSALLASGMGIDKMNVIRKRLERGKGGRLARACHENCKNSRLVTLILSDVLGDPLDLIASGPTVADTSTWNDAWEIIKRYQGLEEKLPSAVVKLLREGLNGEHSDSPGPDDLCFDTSKTTNMLVGNNQVAVEAAAHKAESLGYQPVILGDHVEGEAKDVAYVYTAMAKYLQQTLSNGTTSENLGSRFTVASSLPVALIAGGETTVTIDQEHSNGKGGRNQELALSAAVQLEALKLRNVVLASVGTDGTDGPTDAAGAVVDASTITSTKTQALEALRCHNAYPYLDGLNNNALIKTGPTGTNVADVCVTLVQPTPE